MFSTPKNLILSCYNFISEDHVLNNKSKPVASNKYKIEVQQYVKLKIETVFF